MKAKLIILIASFVLTSNFAFADTIYLKSGKKVEGKIVKRTEKDVIVETPETPLFFSLDMIDHIKEEEIPSATSITTASAKKRKVYSWYEIRNEMMYYYRNPDSERLLPLLEFLLTLSDKDFWELDEPGRRAGPVIHFFATAFRNNKDRLDNLRVLLNKSNDFQKTILNKIIFGIQNYKVINPVDAESFDLVWAEFFATGRKDPILRLINVLEWKVPNDDPYRYADLTVLAWSLSSNIEQHPLVKQICEEELKNRKGLARQRLHEALIYPAEELSRRYMVKEIEIAHRYKRKNKIYDIEEIIWEIKNRPIVWQPFNKELKKPLGENYYDKGMKYAVLGKFKEAKKEFEKALKLNISLYYAKSCLKTIEDVENQKIKMDTALHIFQAVVYGDKNMKDDMISELEKAIAINPYYHRLYYMRADVYKSKWLLDKAISDLDKALEIYPQYAEAYLFKAEVCEIAGRIPGAVEAYKNFILCSPSEYAPYFKGVREKIKQLERQ